ncbi:MAG: hypothetical protein NVS2B4_21870 [Ramlibacter sp.]
MSGSRRLYAYSNTKQGNAKQDDEEHKPLTHLEILSRIRRSEAIYSWFAHIYGG